MTSIFIAGSTLSMGNPLIRRLSERGHQVRALAQPGSEYKRPRELLPSQGALNPKSTHDEKLHRRARGM